MNFSSHIQIRKLTLEEWGQLHATSPQATPFSNPLYLEEAMSTPHYWGVFYKEQLAAGAVLITKNDQPVAGNYGFSVYQSLLLARWIDETEPHRRGILIPRIIGALLERLSVEYSTLHFSIHPAWPDMRPFQWLHYHQPELGLVSLSLQYTALMSLDGDISSGMNESRRGDLKRSTKAGLTYGTSQEIECLVQLHQKTFSRQGHEISQDVKNAVFRTADVVIRNNLGWLQVCRSSDGLTIGAVLILCDARTAYYLIAGNDPDFRNTGAGTALLFEAILEAQRRRLELFDFIGVNSPQRGEFKLGFGGELRPYFTASWKSAQS